MTQSAITYNFPECLVVDDRREVRIAEPADANRLRLILEEDPDIRNHMGWMNGAYSTEELAERILAMRDGRNARYVITEDERVDGYLGIWPSWKLPYENEFDLGYFVAKEARGRGLVQVSARALMGEVACRMTVANFTLFILDSNLQSQATAAKLGFTPTDMTWEDSKWGVERRYIKPVYDQAASS